MTKLSRSAHDEIQKSMAEHGYAVIRGIVSKPGLEALRRRILAEFDAQRHGGTLFTAGGSISGHLNCFPGSESKFVYDALNDSGIVQTVHALSSTPLPSLKVGCNLNLPGSVVQHYHADAAFQKEFIIVNVATVDTGIENGAIELAPGTHKKFYPYWQFVLEAPRRRSVRVLMEQGDVLIRTSNLWHRGMPNNSNEARPMLGLTWERGDGGGDPFAADGDAITFSKNWYRTDFLGELRERAYVAAPYTYSAYRFVSSLFSNRGNESY